MSILESDTIDFVARHPDGSAVKLVIADHLDWENVEEHCKLIQAKVETYLTFIETGQIWDQVPREPPPAIIIELVLRHETTLEIDMFLYRIGDAVEALGAQFSIRIQKI